MRGNLFDPCGGCMYVMRAMPVLLVSNPIVHEPQLLT